MQEWIKRAGADAVPVMFQLLHHRKAKNRLVRRMHQYMDADQPVEELSFLISHVNKYTSEGLLWS